MRVCVIIPAYQAEKSLPQLLAQMEKVFPLNDVLVVDDGSTDGTGEICRRSDVNLLTLNKNRGKGYALRTGFKWAIDSGYDAVITVDADLQHPPNLIPQFTMALNNGADVVIGNRMRDISTMPIERRVSNFLSSFWVSLLAGKKLPDSQCGFRAIKKWVLQKARLHFNRYQAESELLIECCRMGANIKFISIPTIYNGCKSYFHPILDTARFIFFVLTY
ncbi:glycosyltransferase family 2 protein, partial [bacterium]